MKRLNTKDLIPGMQIAEDIFTYNDQLVLPRETVLTDKAIMKLEFYSVLSAKVEDKLVYPLPKTDEDSSYFKKVKSSAAFKEFKAQFNQSVDTFKNLIDSIAEQQESLDTDVLLSNITCLLHDDTGRVNVFDMLHNMRDYDDLTYVHSINVALICNVFAGWLHFTEDDIQTATLCGLLHDIGKIVIPDQIIKKPDKLSAEEYEIIKTHPIRGYQILEKADISEHVKNAVLMHHERCDGSGYPFGLIDHRIEKFAKIVAIADVYDAMTSARVYRGALCPFKVIELFESEGFQKYDTRFVLTFLECIVNTYLQYRVQLTDGTSGDVIFINKNSLSNPIVRVGDNFIDLTKKKNLQIQCFI